MAFLNIFFLLIIFSYNSFNHCSDVDVQKEYSEHLHEIKKEINSLIDEFIKNEFPILREKYYLGAIKAKCKDYCLERYHLLSPDDLKLISEYAESLIEINIDCVEEEYEEAYVMIGESIQEFIDNNLTDLRNSSLVKLKLEECFNFVKKCLVEKKIENIDRYEDFMRNQSRIQILEALR